MSAIAAKRGSAIVTLEQGAIAVHVEGKRHVRLATEEYSWHVHMSTAMRKACAAPPACTSSTSA